MFLCCHTSLIANNIVVSVTLQCFFGFVARTELKEARKFMCVCCRPVAERSFARIGGVRVPGSVLRLGFSRKTGSSLRTSDSSNKSKSPRGVDGKSFEST